MTQHDLVSKIMLPHEWFSYYNYKTSNISLEKDEKKRILLARENGGSREFVQRDERCESRTYEKIMLPHELVGNKSDNAGGSDPSTLLIRNDDNRLRRGCVCSDILKRFCTWMLQKLRLN